MAKGNKASKKKSQRVVKNAKLKQKKEAVQGGDAMDTDGAKASAAQQRESSKDLFKRHAAEWKEVKAQIADMKRQRAKLPKKGQKEEKKALTIKLRTMEQELRDRHDAELKAAGLERQAKMGRGCASDDDDVEVEDDPDI
mmetsp:Transcript_52616/g.125682  ORF Transcript_52616/g.125682 Transcript_52616/m.125682 type:complete len:140 (+) Transcript_52616:124-543(+)|eukprot:CAMPEP_0178425562 /NCGR_PEP_ID=MMETSP0689_2-20121128/28786_1 /TAXON_ID=160604 /ORGANISM="Amphidinium massartii, Strain CS-259" /LENGTH=139 /DNA_ID=CAMNT_0020047227 /DNA_START=92 /DNA_END=511 /DNA_ORIENTATION=-